MHTRGLQSREQGTLLSMARDWNGGYYHTKIHWGIPKQPHTGSCDTWKEWQERSQVQLSPVPSHKDLLYKKSLTALIENQGPAEYISTALQCFDPKHLLQKKRRKYADKMNTDTAHYLLQITKRHEKKKRTKFPLAERSGTYDLNSISTAISFMSQNS